MGVPHRNAAAHQNPSHRGLGTTDALADGDAGRAVFVHGDALPDRGRGTALDSGVPHRPRPNGSDSLKWPRCDRAGVSSSAPLTHGVADSTDDLGGGAIR